MHSDAKDLMCKPKTSRARWKITVQQLKRKSQANDEHARVNASIELSTEDLSVELKETFHSLVVFPYMAPLAIATNPPAYIAEHQHMLGSAC